MNTIVDMCLDGRCMRKDAIYDLYSRQVNHMVQLKDF